MSVAARVAAVTLVASLTAVAAALGAGTPTKPFTVASSIDGQSALPHRFHWRGLPSLPGRQVERVEFIVDGGKPRWIERHTPFVYAEAEGYFVTSWLSPGRHRFTVRATASDGRQASDTVVARVAAEPEVPAQLAGRWRRTIDTTDAPPPGSGGNPTETITPSGAYTLTFEKRWIRDDFPGTFVFPKSNRTGNGLVYLSDYTTRGSTLLVQGEVVFHPLSMSAAEGGAWCYFWGPPATYRWTVSGGTLTLTPMGQGDPCAIRGFVWAGDWRRAG